MDQWPPPCAPGSVVPVLVVPVLVVPVLDVPVDDGGVQSCTSWCHVPVHGGTVEFVSGAVPLWLPVSPLDVLPVEPPVAGEVIKWMPLCHSVWPSPVVHLPLVSVAVAPVESVVVTDNLL
jgi:hypothetical protein